MLSGPKTKQTKQQKTIEDQIRTVKKSCQDLKQNKHSNNKIILGHIRSAKKDRTSQASHYATLTATWLGYVRMARIIG